jgi:hypothetical protein
MLEKYIKAWIYLKKGYRSRTNFKKSEKGCLLADQNRILTRWKGTLVTYWMYMWLVMLGRLKYMELSHLYLSQVALSLRWLLKSLKCINRQLFTFQENWFKQEVGDYAVKTINFVIPFSLRKNPSTVEGVNYCTYLWDDKGMVVNSEIRHCSQVHRNCSQHSSVKVNSIWIKNYWGYVSYLVWCYLEWSFVLSLTRKDVLWKFLVEQRWTPVL